MERRARFERGLAFVGAAALLIVGFDSVTYAATGSSLLLGRINKAGAVTTVQNTGKGAALNLVTRSTGTPPFTTNARGLVKNLYASRAATADRLGGLTLAQIQAAAKGAPGTARAYAVVSPAGAVSHSSGSVSVTRTSIGHYCVTVAGVDPAKSVAIVTPDNLPPQAFVEGSSGGCAGNTGFYVYAFTFGSFATFADEGFMFMVP